MLVFDIETGPLPEEKLKALLPECQLPPHPGEFDPSSVKLGNLKDEAKIAEKIEAARQKHEADVASYEKDCQEKQAEHWESFVDRAALDAGTGQVLAIGYFSESPTIRKICTNDNPADDQGEAALLVEFWKMVTEVVLSKGHRLVGHNIHGFDLPFLMRRSWLLGIQVPDGLLINGRYWNDLFLDTMKVWACGSFNGFTKLDVLASYLGIPGKSGNGADFARLFRENRKAAIDYLKTDLTLTHTVAERLGVR